MASQSAVPSTRRTVVTLPSGGVCSRSRMAAHQLSALQRTPMSLPDMPVSANRCVCAAMFSTEITELIVLKNIGWELVTLNVTFMYSTRMAWCLLWSQRSSLTENMTCCVASMSQRRLVRHLWRSQPTTVVGNEIYPFKIFITR